MRPSLAVREVMTREFVGVSEGDEAAAALSLLAREDAEAAVVFRGSEAVGLLTPLSVATADDSSRAGDVARPVPTRIGADAGLEEAVDAMAADGVRRLLVTDGEEVVGLLTAHDVVTATTFSDEEPPTESASSERDAYVDQSVCESCGTLVATLRSVEGRLVCADCAGG